MKLIQLINKILGKNISWNPIVNYVYKIKKDYIKKFGKIDEYDLELWIKKLNKEEYNLFWENIVTTKFDNIILLRYNIMSKNLDMYKNKKSMYRECRSIVIDLKTLDIIICAPKKFFNVNEVPETEFNKLIKNIKKAKIVEFTNKLDGSMQCLRWYNNKLILTGSKGIDPNCSERVKDGYNRVTPQITKMVSENPNVTFIMEYIALWDAHSVVYSKNQEGLYLIGARRVSDGYEYSYSELKKFANKYNVVMTEIENIDLLSAMEIAKTGSSLNKEGWVINIDGLRVKLKTEEYIKLTSTLASDCSPNNIMKAFYLGYLDDIISSIPKDYREGIEKVRNECLSLIDIRRKNTEKYYDNLCKNIDLNNKKEVMIYINQTIPKEYRTYVINLYYKKENNYFCKDYGGKGDIGFLPYCKMLEIIEKGYI